MITFNICSTEKRKVTSEMNSSSSLGNQIRHHYLKKIKIKMLSKISQLYIAFDVQNTCM